MARGLYSFLFFLVYISAFAQTSIFGEIVLHQDVRLTFFDSSVYFNNGTISDQQTQNAFVVFSGDSQAKLANDDSHIETPILSVNHTDFKFPTGDLGIYQPLSIYDGDDKNLIVHYQQIPYEDLSLPEGVDFISNQFHWLVSGEKTAQLGLSWNSSSLLNQLTSDLEELVILGHTSVGWEVISSKLAPFTMDGITPTSMEEGLIISEDNIAFSHYDAFTLGGIKKVNTIEVSEALTPNGDNVNDTWYIKNIDRYPNVVIRVYNRSGAEVFFHQGSYRNDWNGTYNAKLETLPAAPYYYRIDLENDGYIEHQGWIYINY